MESGFCAEVRTHKFYRFEGFEEWRNRPDFLHDVKLEAQHVRSTVMDEEDDFIYKLPGYGQRVNIGDYIILTNGRKLIVVPDWKFEDQYKIVDRNLL